MTQKLSGGCACGAVQYDCNADPIIMFNCHCRDCQRASGSAYAAIIAVPKAAVQMRGEPRYHKIVGGAGKAIERGFARPAAATSPTNWNGCPTCSHCTRRTPRLVMRLSPMPDAA